MRNDWLARLQRGFDASANPHILGAVRLDLLSTCGDGGDGGSGLFKHRGPPRQGQPCPHGLTVRQKAL
jgi:hypothetical protein